MTFFLLCLEEKKDNLVKSGLPGQRVLLSSRVGDPAGCAHGQQGQGRKTSSGFAFGLRAPASKPQLRQFDSSFLHMAF